MSRGTTFGNCEKHGDYCGSSCPFCQIDELKEDLRGLIKRLDDNGVKGCAGELITLKDLLEKLGGKKD